MTEGIFIAVSGLKEALKRLEDVPDQIVNRSIVRVNKMVMAPVLSKARDLAPRGLTGATLESLDFKTKVYKRKGIVFTIVGPTVGHRVKIAERRLRTRHWMSTKTMREVWHDPVLTSHLVEKGHGGPHPAKAHPFLRPAAESQFPLMEGRYGAALRAEIDRLARKGVA